MRFTRRHPVALALILGIAFAGIQALHASAAQASATQQSIFEPGGPIQTDTGGTLLKLRELGVTTIRLFMSWSSIAPKPTSRSAPKHFNGASPAAYPASNWATWDTIIKAAQSSGIRVDLDLGGKAPLWAEPRVAPAHEQGSYAPDSRLYKAFVEAVGKRYSGSYNGLPRVNFWSVWNEPNYVSSLHPQGTGPGGRIPNTPHLYRALLDAAWSGLHATGHGGDTLIIGELAPRGFTNFGPHSHGYMFPVTFVQSLYCVDSHYHPLRGSTARLEGCPTTSGGSRAFRGQHPVLFKASGFANHPYPEWYPPTREGFSGCRTNLCSSFAELGNLTKALDKVQRAYKSNTKFPIYSTEYGYKTAPPLTRPFLSPTVAAGYLNWAEYLSYKNPRVRSFDQYLLLDPVKPGAPGNYPSGLLTWDGKPKADYAAWRLPLYLPKTSASAGQTLEVWGGARPAPYAAADTGLAQSVAIQFQPNGGAWTTLQTVTISNPMGYIDARVPFTQSGNVRLAYTYPASDPMLPAMPGETVVSRSVKITVH